MRWINIALLILLLLGWSCEELPPEVYENPIDEEETPIETPALVFFPAEVNVSLGLGANIQVYAMGIENLSGAHIALNYDNIRLSLLSISAGDFFAGAEETTFFTEHDADAGTIDIFTSYLGGDTVAVDGTGNLASIAFMTIGAGQSTLTYSTESEFVDPDNIPIVIEGFGSGVINAE